MLVAEDMALDGGAATGPINNGVTNPPPPPPETDPHVTFGREGDSYTLGLEGDLSGNGTYHGTLTLDPSTQDLGN